jgi:hypothetical protein
LRANCDSRWIVAPAAVARRRRQRHDVAVEHGSVPGKPRQTGQVAEFAGAPTVTGQAQKILERVWSWAWTSSPMTGKTLILRGVSMADTDEY